MHSIQGLFGLVQFRLDRSQPVLSFSETRLGLILGVLIGHRSKELIRQLIHLKLKSGFFILEILNLLPELLCSFGPVFHGIGGLYASRCWRSDSGSRRFLIRGYGFRFPGGRCVHRSCISDALGGDHRGGLEVGSALSFLARNVGHGLSLG